MKSQESSLAISISKIIALAAVNFFVLYLALNGVPAQDESLLYGIGQLLNIDATTQEEFDALDPEAYATNFIYNAGQCDYEPEAVQRMVFYFIVGNKGNV